MRKLLSIVLTLVMAAGMFACSIPGGSAKRNIDLEKVRQIKGTLLEITHQSAGEMTQEEFEASCYSQKVTYSGDAYNPFQVVGGIKMSDEDFLEVYEFCLDAYENGTFDDYKEDVCDGSTFTFTYYDENGDAHTLYSGYIYGNEELSGIVDIIGKYSLD